LQRAAAELDRAGLDRMLLGPGPDMFFLSGFEHSHAGRRLLALILGRNGSASWIAPTMNIPQIDEKRLPDQPLRSWSDDETYLPALREALQGVERLAFDDEARAAFLMDLLETAPGIRVQKAGEVMAALRMRKDTAELAQLRAAAKTVDDTVADAIAMCRPGRTEQEIDTELRAALLGRSPESTVAFTIVGSGPNTALPHHEVSDRVLQPGDVMILDYGTRRHGYHSDITVTCSAGEPADPEVRKVYRVVWEAQQRALEAVRPGVPCEEVDRAARGVITAAGYGEYFIHRTGHGLGLQLHEPPFMVGGNRTLLEEGMVFSVEPGVYLPGRWGLRLEVIASVAADGVSLINAPRARELPVAGA
jgi:Xaa-Pro aminopeptidase